MSTYWNQIKSVPVSNNSNSPISYKAQKQQQQRGFNSKFNYSEVIPTTFNQQQKSFNNNINIQQQKSFNNNNNIQQKKSTTTALLENQSNYLTSDSFKFQKTTTNSNGYLNDYNEKHTNLTYNWEYTNQTNTKKRRFLNETSFSTPLFNSSSPISISYRNILFI